jgi:carbon monoxide dehydrogenase subunit G
MQLENTFTIPTGIDEAWAAFNDPGRVAPCFPGATLTGTEGDTFTGTVKVKLGPISLTYKGKGTFVERDEAAHKVVIDASGRDARGNGTASAVVTGTLTPDGDTQTTVRMITDMTVTGRPAQFGRGVMADVSDKIVGQFASCLAEKLGPGSESSGAASGAAEKAAGSAKAGLAEVSGQSGAAGAAVTAVTGSAPRAGSAGVATASPTPASADVNGSAPSSAPRLASAPDPVSSEVEPIDLLDTAGGPVLKRLVPVLLGLIALIVALRVIKARKS